MNPDDMKNDTRPRTGHEDSSSKKPAAGRSAWQKSFARGWTDINKSQRLDRAQYIVTEGIKAGHDISEIARATEYTDHGVSRSSVQRYIDLVAFSQVPGPGHPPQVSSDQLDIARSTFKEQLEVGDDDAAKYARENGVDEAVARRMIEGEKLYSVMKAGGLIGEDGKVNLDVPKSREQKRLEGMRNYTASMGWSQTALPLLGATLKYLRFLRGTDQSKMNDGAVSRSLRRIGAQFEEQADRFEIGHEKHQARKTAGKGGKGGAK